MLSGVLVFIHQRDLKMKRTSRVACRVLPGWALLPLAVLPLAVAAQVPAVAPPVINTQPSSLNLSVGTTGTFAVEASGDGPLLFQWRWNGTNLPGATDSIMSVA